GHGGGHENHERWLITYSDLITLLMIFFVIMYAMSKIDQSRFTALSISLQKALKPSNEVQMQDMGTSGIVSRSPVSNQKTTKNQNNVDQKNTSQNQQTEKEQEKQAQQQEDAQQKEQKKLDDLLKKVQKYVQDNKLSGLVSVMETAQGVQITLNDAALFDSGSADLKPTAMRILGGLAPFMEIVPNKIAIEGHTDDRPIKSGKFPSNWELSSQRAINVLHFLESSAVPHDRMHAVGYADTVPLAKNDSDANRASNRRVNLIILRDYKAKNIAPIDPNNLITSN
ncbi:MAG: OmpA/MotB family protein, partial [Tumebacillaceae bacterium]